ncbi:MAG: endonuclease III [Magnetococcales bacterium]|nr:endonuclease III [Magnetococcales bacterium]MBF0437740.1 endonuclease III [Magnetococcales bacterium]
MENYWIIALFSALREANPQPKSALFFHSPYELLVAVVLSAQSTDVGVNRVTPGLFALASDPASMVRLGEDGLREQIRSLGLYNNKAKNILALSRILLEEYHGQVPDTREALESLPGVGRKSANVVLNVAFGHPTVAVDTHVFRVANRTGLAPGKTPEAVEKKLLQCVPEEFLLHAHHWLILHGRHVCMARKPNCENCCIRTWCLMGGNQFKDK